MPDLVFVYNADSRYINALFDAGHKIISPDTYSCDLCSLTYGRFLEKTEWKRFRENFKGTIEYYHRDEFEKKYGKQQYSYPLILRRENGRLAMVATPGQISQFSSIEKLVNFLKNLE